MTARRRCRSCAAYISLAGPPACYRHVNHGEHDEFLQASMEMAMMRRTGAHYRVIAEQYGIPVGTARDRVLKVAPHLRSGKRRHNMEKVVEQAALIFDTTSKDIVSPARFQHIVFARHAAAKVMRERGASYPFIGSLLGNRDHGSIIHACRKAAILAESIPGYAERLDALRAAA